jgi:hypothetical protein
MKRKYSLKPPKLPKYTIFGYEFALVSSTPVLPLCACPKNRKQLATRVSTLNGSCSPGFDTCRGSRGVREIRCRRDSARQRSRPHNRQPPQGAPDRQLGSVWCATPMASKESVAMFNFLRHVSQVDPFVAD